MEIFTDPSFELDIIVATLFYALMGMTLMVSSVIIFDKVFKLELHKELVEEHNMAFGVLFAGVAVSMGLIIAASILS